MKWHYLNESIVSTTHKITVDLIGCGGTGSHMLSNLAMINKSLIQLERQPLAVRVFDPDVVGEHNIGRQLFSPADIDQHKAEVLVTRINRFYGTNWLAFPYKYGYEEQYCGNILISCVDSVKSRKSIYDFIKKEYDTKEENQSWQIHNTPFYWMDLGNGKNYGQVLLSTLYESKKNLGIKNLPTFFKEFPNVKDDKLEPSCSAAESLARQDLFINKMLSTLAAHMLWDLFKNFRINYRGIYLNLENMKTSKIPIE